MKVTETVIIVAGVLGAIASWMIIRGRRTSGEAPAPSGWSYDSNPISRASDKLVRNTFAFPDSLDSDTTLGTWFFDQYGPRPPEAAAANPISRASDKLARAASSSARPSDTLGTILYDFFNPNPDKPSAVGNVRAQVGPLLPRHLAIIDST